jgi:hypothetical protein
MWEDNIILAFRETGYKHMKWIEIVQVKSNRSKVTDEPKVST